MKSRFLINKSITGMLMFLLMTAAYAGNPLWTFTPDSSFPPHTSVSATGTATVKYTITNNSTRKSHQLVLSSKTPAGISQVGGPCVVVPNNGSGNATCTLTLSINGSALPTSGLSGGPVLCQANPDGTPNNNQCYQPSKANSLNITKAAAAYTVGGQVFGLLGTLVLQNSGGDALTMNADGSFTFSNPLPSGSTYSVTIQSQPATQTCTVSNGSGTIVNANATNVVVHCSTNAFTVGGTISGLSASESVILQNNGGDNLTISANGNFTFSTSEAAGATYAVTILTQPTTQTCTVSNGSGTIVANVTSVIVTCAANAYTVGGSVSGLLGTVVLQNNGGDNLTINTNGSFTFLMPVAEGANYTVSVLTQPTAQTCTVSNGSGTMGGSNVNNVAVTCVTNTTLTTSVSDLALSVNDTTTNAALTGHPRTITILNIGSDTAEGLSINYPTWPTGTTASSTCGANLASGARCTITITPGASATSTCTTGIAPTPGVVSVAASNASSVSTNVVVLSYGCIYQGGYIYNVVDTTVNTGSIAGNVAATSDQAPTSPNGIIWSSNSVGSYDNGVSIWGIDETSTSTSPSPNTTSAEPATLYSGQLNCNGSSVGACNTNNIYIYYHNYAAGAPISTVFYAAGLCKATINGYSDWYLPAICEMGYGISACGSSNAPTLQNMQSNLVDIGNIGALASFYWSSTEASSIPQGVAWFQFFASGGGSAQGNGKKFGQLGVRCSRALTL